jgi:hypothetical protein
VGPRAAPTGPKRAYAINTKQPAIDFANPAQWYRATRKTIDDIARQSLIVDLQRLDTDDPSEFVDAPDPELIESTDAVSVWRLWPDQPAHLVLIRDPEGNKFVLIGCRPEPKGAFLALSLGGGDRAPGRAPRAGIAERRGVLGGQGAAAALRSPAREFSSWSGGEWRWAMPAVAAQHDGSLVAGSPLAAE